MEAGIPVICSNTDIADKKWRYGHVGMENFPGGYLQGKYVVENLLKGKPGKAMILTGIGLENLGTRTKGIEAAFAEAKSVEVVDVVNDQLDPNLGTQACSSSLLAHPDINVIVGTDSSAGESASRAVKESGRKPGEIIIMGMDRDDSMLVHIKEGWMAATAVQRNFLEFYLDVYMLQNHVRQLWVKGAFPGAPSDALGKLPHQLPYVTDTGVMFCTAENVDYFFHEKPK
jgi:ABC-type sugar transport system substrate-binding protein